MQQLSHAHLKSMLWSHGSAQVYAVINGAVVPDLQALLDTAKVKGWSCLWRGALPPEKKAVAPCLVALLPDSEFTDWLLGKATEAYPGWGIVGISSLSMLNIREHCRRLLQVGMPDGSQAKWTWFDPTLFAPLLPKLDPMQLDEVFGPMTDWVSISPSVWQWMTLSAGQLVVTSRDCAAA